MTTTFVTFGLLMAGMALAVLVSMKMGWLTRGGGAAAWLVGAGIILAGGPIFLFPMVIFFVTGSLSDKLHQPVAKQQGRTAMQVLANGGMAVVCLILWKITDFHPLMAAYVASVGISITDTISGDAGMAYGNTPYDIVTLKPVDAGMSGGITLAGTLAGLAVAMVFAGIHFFVFDLWIKDLYLIAVFSFAGMLTDSLLGSLWQSKYMDRGVLTESSENNAVLVKGMRWMTNDMVNLLSNALNTLAFVVVSAIVS